MDSYLFKLLKLLIENGSMTTQDIAYYGNVSKRTVTNRINELNNVLGDTAQVLKESNRYQLIINNYPDFLHLETQFLKGELDLNDPVKRESFIIYHLISNKSFITLDDLADQMLISKKVVTKDVQNLREKLTQYNTKIESMTGKGIKIVVKHDYGFLFILRNFVISHTSSDVSDSKTLDQFNDTVANLVIKPEIKNKILNNLLSLKLARKANITIHSFPNTFISLWKEDNVVKILKKFFKDIIADITDEELLFLLSPLNLYKNDSLDEQKLDVVFKQNYEILISSLEDNLLKYGLNFKNLYSRIKWHLLFLVNRSLLHESISEILPKGISKDYPISLEFSINLSKSIEENYHVHVNQEEIDYCVIYFQMFLDERTENRTDEVNVAFIGSIRNSVKSFIENKLLQVFDQLKTTDFSSISKFNEVDPSNYLMAFSDKPFSSPKTQVVNIGTVFRPEALSTILQISVVEHLTELNLCKIFVTKINAKNYHEAVKKLIADQVKVGEFNEDFEEKWSNREKDIGNIFSNGIAIPHAVDSSNKQRILISVGIVNNKLSFRNREVKLIFLIAIPNTLNDDLVNATSRVYDLIELISRNSVLYSNFLKYDNSKKLGQIAEGV